MATLQEGDVLETTFTKSVIRSRAALTYAEAMARIEDESDRSEVTAGLRLLLELAMNLRKRRFGNGALEVSRLFAVACLPRPRVLCLALLP